MSMEVMKLALEALQEAVNKAGWIGMSPEGWEETQREVDEYVTQRLEPAIVAINAAIEAAETQEPVGQLQDAQPLRGAMPWEQLYPQFGDATPPAAQPAPVQVSPTDFVDMVMDKEDAIGKPIFWAEWPNRETNK